MRRTAHPRDQRTALVIVVAGWLLACGRSAKDLPITSTRTGPVMAARAHAAELRSPSGEHRHHCDFRAGALPAETLEPDAPLGAAMPIDHFVVVMQENRSFDQYFAKLAEQGGPKVEIAPPEYVNEDRGRRVRPFLLTSPCVADVPHEWNHVHTEWNAGHMNGFLRAAGPDGDRVLGYYDSTTLPYYYALASTFALADNYHADVLGPTWPNRMYFLAGTSFGHIDNEPPPARDEERSLFHELEEHDLSWIVYAESKTFEEEIFPRLHAEKGHHFLPLARYFEDAKAGRLPNFAWVESTFGSVLATDEHPPADIEIGQVFVANVVSALLTSPNWPRSALFWTYDEAGGFFDHVPPPSACPPDQIPPNLGPRDAPGEFAHLGMRVPLVVVSPYAKPRFAGHGEYSHASLLRLVEARFGLPALTERDANANVPFELFDFSSQRFSTLPTLPVPKINPLARARCERTRDGEVPLHPAQ